jgi:hypothetical protein
MIPNIDTAASKLASSKRFAVLDLRGSARVSGHAQAKPRHHRRRQVGRRDERAGVQQPHCECAGAGGDVEDALARLRCQQSQPMRAERGRGGLRKPFIFGHDGVEIGKNGVGRHVIMLHRLSCLFKAAFGLCARLF